MRNRKPKSKPRKHLINRAEVARRLGITQAYVDMLFRGERKNLKRLREIQDLVLDELTAVDHLRRTVKSSRGRRENPGALSDKKDDGSHKEPKPMSH